MNAWTRWSALLINHVANGLAVVFIASILCVSVGSAQIPNQKPGVGRVIGGINGITYEGERPYLTGWACQQGQTSAIQVHVFADDSAKESSK
jgi:hypothetical protein